jgi:hypothetical protein
MRPRFSSGGCAFSVESVVSSRTRRCPIHDTHLNTLEALVPQLTGIALVPLHAMCGPSFYDRIYAIVLAQPCGVSYSRQCQAAGLGPRREATPERREPQSAASRMRALTVTGTEVPPAVRTLRTPVHVVAPSVCTHRVVLGARSCLCRPSPQPAAARAAGA